MGHMFNHKSNLSLPRVKWPVCDSWFSAFNSVLHVCVYLWKNSHFCTTVSSSMWWGRQHLPLLAADGIHACSASKEGDTHQVLQVVSSVIMGWLLGDTSVAHDQVPWAVSTCFYAIGTYTIPNQNVNSCTCTVKNKTKADQWMSCVMHFTLTIHNIVLCFSVG